MGSAYCFFESTYQFTPNVNDVSSNTPSCEIYAESNAGYLPTLCGHSKLSNKFLLLGDTTSNYRIWVVWANCIIWLLYCIVEKSLGAEGYIPFRARAAARFRRNRILTSLRKTFRRCPFWTLIYASVVAMLRCTDHTVHGLC